MKKVVKFVLRAVFVIVLLLAALLLIHPLWVGPTGAGIARRVVPDMTKSDFKMDSLGVNLYSGKVAVEGVCVKNPGDEKTDAVSLKALRVEFSALSMLTEERRIKEIVIDGLKVFGDMTFSNLRQIVANIDEYVGEEKEDAEDGDAKLVIDRVFITGAEFRWGLVNIVLPDVELRDIGRNDAATGEDAFGAIVDALCSAADKVAAGSGKALKLAVEGGDKLSEGVKAVSGAVSGAVDVGGKAVDGAKKAVDGIKGIFR